MKRETIIHLARGCSFVEKDERGKDYIDCQGSDATHVVENVANRAVDYALLQAAERVMQKTAGQPPAVMALAREFAAVVTATKEGL